MNVELIASALGVTDPIAEGALPLTMVDGRPVTISTSWSVESQRVARQRGTPLVVLDAVDPADPTAARPNPLQRHRGACGRLTSACSSGLEVLPIAMASTRRTRRGSSGRSWR
jgi:hypothetical protein